MIKKSKMVWLSEGSFLRYRGFTEVFDKKPWSPSGDLEDRISMFDFKLCINEDLSETSSYCESFTYFGSLVPSIMIYEYLNNHRRTSFLRTLISQDRSHQSK